MVRLTKNLRPNLNKRPGRGPNLNKRPPGPGERPRRDFELPDPFEDPLENHRPIGGGFEVAVPMASQDPLTPDLNPYLLTPEQLCENHPTSPSCNIPDGEAYNPDGKFFRPTLSNPFQPGWDTEIVKSDCIVGFRFTPTWLWLNFPPFEIIWRDPNCKEDEPEPEPEPDPEEPPPPRPPDWPGGSPNPNLYVEIVVDRWLYDGDPDPERATGAECIHAFWPESKLASLTGRLYAPDRTATISHSYNPYTVRTSDRGFGFAVETWQNGSWRFVGYNATDALTAGEGDVITGHRAYGGSTLFIDRFDPTSQRDLYVWWKVATPDGDEYLVSANNRWSLNTELDGRGHQFFLRNQSRLSPSVEISLSHSSIPTGGFARYRGLVRDLTAFLTMSYPPKILGVYSGGTSVWRDRNDPALRGIGCHPAPKKPEPPPPPPPYEEPMGCNDDILKAILARIERIEKTIESPSFFDCKGATDTGAVTAKQEKDLPSAPDRLIYPHKRGNNKKKHLKTLMEVLEFQIRQVDRAVGDLPITIKIKDSDPSKEGDQKVEAEFHTIGQALKELTEISIDTQGDTDLTNLMIVRALFELGFIHQGTIQSHYWIEAIADWLDFPIKNERKKFPFSFNPRVGVDMSKGFGEDGDPQAPDTEAEFEKIAPKLLKETDVPIKIVKLDPKQKTTDHDAIQEILRAVRMLLASVTEEATPEKLEQIIALERLAIKLSGLQNRSDVKKAVVDGLLTAKPKKD